MTLSYKRYSVEVLNEKDEVIQVVEISAWSEDGAVEKVHKRVNGGSTNKYRLTKISGKK